MEPNIEREYLSAIHSSCAQTVKYKNELEYKLSYYRHSMYRGVIENELRSLDFTPCEKFNRLKDVFS
jgi:hypothetical protein